MLSTLDRQFSYSYHRMSNQDPIKFYTLMFYGRDLNKYKKTLVKPGKKQRGLQYTLLDIMNIGYAKVKSNKFSCFFVSYNIINNYIFNNKP